MSMLTICCSVCGKSACITDPYNDGDLDVNRSVLAMRTIGKGRAGLATFSGMMGMKPPPPPPPPPPLPSHAATPKTRNCWWLLRWSAKRILIEQQHSSADMSGDQIADVKVTCDATWKRGHTSPYLVLWWWQAWSPVPV